MRGVAPSTKKTTQAMIDNKKTNLFNESCEMTFPSLNLALCSTATNFGFIELLS